MKKYRSFISLISRGEAFFCGVALAVMVTTNFIEILRRQLFSKSFVWIQELSIILICWIVYIGAAYIYSTGALLNVDFLYLRSKGLVRLIWDLICHILTFFLLLILIVYGSQYAAVQSAASTFALKAPMSFYSIPLVIAACSMLLDLVLKIYDSVIRYQTERREGE